MTDVQITELFYQQLDALGDYDHAAEGAAACAASMKKQISVWTLADIVSGMSLNEGKSTDGGEDDNNDESSFMVPILLQYVDSLMATEDNADLVEQAMDLLSALAVTYGESTSEAVADKAMEYSIVLLERVRTQACKLMGFMALHLTRSEEDWAEEWFDALKEAVVPRMSDKGQSVRHAAARFSAHFFGGKSETVDDLLEVVLWSMWHDPSVAVRVAALDAVPIAEETVPHIVARMRDEKEKVRLQAIDVLKSKVNPLSDLSKENFAEIIRSGLSSRCDTTKRETEKLICSRWMKSAKFCPVELLRRMGPAIYEEECEKAIQVVLDAIRADDTEVVSGLSAPEVRAFQSCADENVIELSDADVEFGPEDIFFSRIACCSAQASDILSPIQKEKIINSIAPDIQIICQLLARHIGMLVQATGNGDNGAEDAHSFVCLQLLRLAQVVGLREEGSRRLFLSAIQEVLSSPETPDDLVEECVRSLKTTHETEYDFFATISITMSEILALQTDSAESKMHLTLRNLTILTIVFESASANMANHHTLDDFAECIVEAIQDSSALVREAGVSALGRLGMLTTEATVIAVYKPLLLSIAANQDEKLEIRSQALMALSDWSLLFPQVLLPCHCSDRTISLIDVISETMKHKNTTMMAFSAEVAAKLLLAGRICESNLISTLLVIFFDPDLLSTENDNVDEKEIGSPIRLQQVLSLFFPAYCIKSETGRDAMMGSIDSALEMAINSSKAKKKRSSFPYVKLVEFVCSMVDTGKQSAASMEAEPASPRNEDEYSYATTIVLALIQVARFLGKDNSLNLTETRAMCKFLCSQDLEVSTNNSFHLHSLKELVEELSMVLTDATSLRSIKTISALLEDIPEHSVMDSDGDANSAGDASSQGTVTEDEADNDDVESTGETTVEDSLMESMTALSVKENSRPLRSSTRSKGDLSRGSLEGKGVLSSRGNSIVE
mmetsp:Transcript_13565/g.21352  ORF Transcript_13565/g.21352 Transcript_13565/m.21352 type:complete len:957 (+) Transcript_13565:64-2934(+)|eukprot:CAMPEP_0117012016 /NCGR_PEP_ID=MMETSP0472-20121206/10209_1 /TAXON_ID=693140 ORGANISM="Tiarina fusus, Strain LIS" /NCGR_SAMPLE_ID=MMETSP0472 /ASSEMBLY_ACC=CAM_ASM_000603 /LENGTH=956 /DNA_ID=CAMNT_0004714989 /DNA_START=60 /DNA_END=2930 /DNA_ORIENTATION=+